MPETCGGAYLPRVNASRLLAEMTESFCPLLEGCLCSVQFSWSVVSNSLHPHGQASLSITNSWRVLKLMSIELMPLSHLILCRSILLLPSLFPSIKVFSKSQFFASRGQFCSFSFSISRSNEYSGLISFRVDWLDLLAVQGTLKSLLQHHSSKASVLQRSAFFMVHLSYP